jgi:hypothetical protein
MNILIEHHTKNLDKQIEAIDTYILSGPSSDINSDEVAMEYMRRVGKREALLDIKESWESTVRAFLGGQLS